MFLIFKCDKCDSKFDTKRGLVGHTMGKHKALKCSICSSQFDKKSEIGKHKIEIHGYSRKQLGWNLVGGWNKGLTQLEAFNVTGNAHHGNAEFMNSLNTPEYLRVKKLNSKSIMRKW